MRLTTLVDYSKGMCVGRSLNLNTFPHLQYSSHYVFVSQQHVKLCSWVVLSKSYKRVWSYELFYRDKYNLSLGISKWVHDFRTKSTNEWSTGTGLNVLAKWSVPSKIRSTLFFLSLCLLSSFPLSHSFLFSPPLILLLYFHSLISETTWLKVISWVE
jgi:hypothetical protein